MSKIVYRNLEQSILEDGVSKKAIAGLIGLTPCKFSNLLRGKYELGKLSISDIDTLCRFLRKSRKYLFSQERSR